MEILNSSYRSKIYSKLEGHNNKVSLYPSSRGFHNETNGREKIRQTTKVFKGSRLDCANPENTLQNETLQEHPQSNYRRKDDC